MLTACFSMCFKVTFYTFISGNYYPSRGDYICYLLDSSFLLLFLALGEVSRNVLLLIYETEFLGPFCFNSDLDNDY